jgi:hypothetical protein
MFQGQPVDHRPPADKYGCMATKNDQKCAWVILFEPFPNVLD